MLLDVGDMLNERKPSDPTLTLLTSDRRELLASDCGRCKQLSVPRHINNTASRQSNEEEDSVDGVDSHIVSSSLDRVPYIGVSAYHEGFGAVEE
ncbi:hypothetical protein Tco_1387153 [Tanacetum coccineum]